MLSWGKKGNTLQFAIDMNELDSSIRYPPLPPAGGSHYQHHNEGNAPAISHYDFQHPQFSSSLSSLSVLLDAMQHDAMLLYPSKKLYS